MTSVTENIVNYHRVLRLALWLVPKIHKIILHFKILLYSIYLKSKFLYELILQTSNNFSRQNFYILDSKYQISILFVFQM